MFSWRSARGRAFLAGIAFMLILAVVAIVAISYAREQGIRLF